MARARRWCFTLNNYNPEDWLTLQFIQQHSLSHKIQYLIAEQETAPHSGTRHIQGYIEFTERYYMQNLKDLFSFLRRAHLEPAKGTRSQNKDYCTKEHPDGQLTTEFVRDSDPKQPTYDQLATFIKENTAPLDIFEQFPRLYLQHRNAIISTLTDYRQQTLKTGPYHLKLKLKNLWIWGEPGTGKSYFAESRNMTTYVKNTNKWWDGYQGQELVIIEDLDPDSCKHMAKFLKNWADDYPFLAEIKGAAQLWPPTFCFIITSNYHPQDCFENQQDLQAILRRFSVIKFSLLRGERMAEIEGLQPINPLENLKDLPRLSYTQ